MQNSSESDPTPEQEIRERIAASSPLRPDAESTDLAWHRLQARIADRPAVPRRRVALRRTAIRIAAGFAVVIGAASLWPLVRPGPQRFEAAAGAPVMYIMPDGSRLTLSPGSHAELSRGFGRASREVTLTGEGYFDVVHDSARPFRVHARDGVAEDVGTRFVVRAWPELGAIEVAVEEGIVALAGTSASRVTPAQELTAGERGRLGRDGTVTVSSVSDGEFAWLSGELVFDDAPLSVALPAIGRWFDVDLLADSALTDRRLSARLGTRSLPQLLDGLALALDVRIAREGRIITLSPR